MAFLGIPGAGEMQARQDVYTQQAASQRSQFARQRQLAARRIASSVGGAMGTTGNPVVAGRLAAHEAGRVQGDLANAEAVASSTLRSQQMAHEQQVRQGEMETQRQVFGGLIGGAGQVLGMAVPAFGALSGAAGGLAGGNAGGIGAAIGALAGGGSGNGINPNDPNAGTMGVMGHAGTPTQSHAPSSWGAPPPIARDQSRGPYTAPGTTGRLAAPSPTLGGTSGDVFGDRVYSAGAGPEGSRSAMFVGQGSMDGGVPIAPQEESFGQRVARLAMGGGGPIAPIGGWSPSLGNTAAPPLAPSHPPLTSYPVTSDGARAFLAPRSTSSPQVTPEIRSQAQQMALGGDTAGVESLAVQLGVTVDQLLGGYATVRGR
jgi:hypothetical protein